LALEPPEFRRFLVTTAHFWLTFMQTNDEREREIAKNTGRNECASACCSLESAESYVAGSPGSGAAGDGSREAFRASFHALLEWGETHGLIFEASKFLCLGRHPDGHGHEHEAWYDPCANRWTKATYQNRFGCAWGRSESATAREYLTRLVLQNNHFGDDIQLVGLVNCDGRLRVLTTQRHVAGTAASLEEIKEWFGSLNFKRVQNGSEIAWYCEKLNLLVSDAHQRNVIRTPDGYLVPIDLNILQPSGEWLTWVSGAMQSIHVGG
jgi:hypothetical protein